MIAVARLTAADRAAWGELAAGYKAFYNTPTSAAEYDEAWRRLMADDGVHALGARLDGRLVGIVHYLFHTGTWARDACYLQDLYTDPAARGQGVARALIEAVAQAARQRGATRLYWLTQDHNSTARALYDKVAAFKGFIRYDYPLS
ncbi:MAG: GNAT family N-acetyltransferase [Rubrivivax sp.]|nr:GNAT family N-acetyltransferase [Rubrivivax sp.]